MFSLSLNPTQYQTEYWNKGLQLLMMHKYFSSQHSPFHNYIHEVPRSSSPFIIYFTLLWPVPRHFSRPSTGPEQHKALTPPLLEPAPVPPVLRAKSSKAGNVILCVVKELTVSNWTLWKQILSLRGQNVPRMTPLPAHPTSSQVSQGVTAPLLLSQIPAWVLG